MISHSHRVLACSPAHTLHSVFKVLKQGVHEASFLCCGLIGISLSHHYFFKDLYIHKQHRPLCTRTISAPHCTQSTGLLTGTHLHIMSPLRPSPSVHMPVTECLSLGDSTCLQGTSESWILHIAKMAKTPEVRYLGYSCFPDSSGL